MKVGIEIDTRQFVAGLTAILVATKRSLPEVVNQRSFNIAARTVDSMKPAPGGEQAQRTKIKRYMEAQISTRLRIFKRGKRAGKFGRAGSKANQLQRVNLIIQARRARIGLPGLSGEEMAKAEGKFKKAAQVGVGFLKSPFLPIIKGLVAHVRFKKVATRWGRISVWPGSAGYGRVKVATPGEASSVEMEMKWQVPGVPTKVQTLILPHLQAAVNAEGQEMLRHAESKLQSEFNRVNTR